MADYDGSHFATNDEYSELLARVIRETFPMGAFHVRIRQTKAMLSPLASISIERGPVPNDLVQAIPLLAQFGTHLRFAYRGKVLPHLRYSVRIRNAPELQALSKQFWQAIQQSSPTLIARNPRRCRQKHERHCAAALAGQHPAQPSPTMAEMLCGPFDQIEAVAVAQRRDDLAASVPQATSAASSGSHRRRL